MHFINCILNMIFPKVCGICGKVNNYDLCPKCRIKLNQIKICKKHIYLKKNYTTHMYIFNYNDLIRKNLITYKFYGQAYKHKSFANFMIKDKKVYKFVKKYDIIIPVPISKKRKLKRGYNQSALITREIVKLDENIKTSNSILYKVKDTVPQSSLNKEKRKDNLKNAYEVRNSEMINKKKILLFDDIYTTGSTVEECSKVLKLAGAYEVRCVNNSKRLNQKGVFYGRFS